MEEPQQAPAPAPAEDFAPPGKAAIRLPEGTIKLVDASRAKEAMEAYEARPATDVEYYGAKAGGVGTAIAGGAAAARVGTLGLSDKGYVEAARAIGGDEHAESVRRGLNLMREAHPDADTAGTVIGALAPLLIGDTAPAAGSAAKLGLRAIGRATAEGAAFGVGQQFSDDTLENHDLSAENYITAGVKGGAIGLLLGAGGHALGAARYGGRAAEAVEAAAERPALAEAGEVASHVAAREKVPGYVSMADADAGLGHEASAGRPINIAELPKNRPFGIRDPMEDVSLNTGESSAYPARRPFKIGEPIEPELPVTPRGPMSSLEGAAAEKQFEALGPRAKDWRNIGRTEEEQTTIARRIGDRVSKEVDGVMPLGKMSDKVTAWADREGTKLAKMRAKLDNAAETPLSANIVERFENDVVAPASRMPLGEKDVAHAVDWLEDFVKKNGENPSFKASLQARLHLDEWLDKAHAFEKRGMPPPPGVEAMRGLRKAMVDEYERAADVAAKQMGDLGFSDAYKLQKEIYGDAAEAKKIVTRAAAADKGKPLLDRVDLATMVGAAISGHPLLAAAPLVRSGMRKFGDQIAAYTLRKADSVGAIRGAVESVDAAIRGGTKDFLNGKTGKIPSAAPRMTSADVRALQTAVASDDAVMSRVTESLGAMGQHAPKVAQSAMATAMRAAAFLRRELPKETRAPSLTFGQQTPRAMSDSELTRITREVDTLKDGPDLVVDLLKQGRLTRDHVRALREVYPASYQRIQDYLQEHATELQPRLTMQQECGLSLLFDQPINAAMQAQNIKALQAVFAPQDPNPLTASPVPQQGAPKGAIDLGKTSGSSNTATAWDHMEGAT